MFTMNLQGLERFAPLAKVNLNRSGGLRFGY